MTTDLLKSHARHDLQKLMPSAHYWLREHAPIADRELTTPLLQNPIGLSPREYVAAKALASLATYEIESRAIWEKAYPARDIGDKTDCPGETFDEERKIWALLEVFRGHALVYAREIENSQLIEAYQNSIPAPEHDSNTPLPESTHLRRERCLECGNSTNAVARPNETLLASRDQLIAAFGTFTGMNISWFKNLSDVPKLKAARKVAGKGQRGHTIQPLFCPYEVMQWLIDPRRKKGKPLSSDKGWSKLNTHFENVYTLKEINDPREISTG